MPRDDIAAFGGQPQVTQHFQRTQQNRQRRTAGSDPLQVVFVEGCCGSLDESPDQAVVVLRRGLPEQVADLEVGTGVLLKPIRMAILTDQRQQLIQQARARHAVAQSRLIGRQHE